MNKHGVIHGNLVGKEQSPLVGKVVSILENQVGVIVEDADGTQWKVMLFQENGEHGVAFYPEIGDLVLFSIVENGLGKLEGIIYPVLQSSPFREKISQAYEVYANIRRLVLNAEHGVKIVGKTEICSAENEDLPDNTQSVVLGGLVCPLTGTPVHLLPGNTITGKSVSGQLKAK
jgi:hypothetical protein